MTGSSVAEQLQRSSSIPGLSCVSLCMATTSRSFPRSRSCGRCDRGCAGGATSRCVAFLVVESVCEIEIVGRKKFEVDRGRASVRNE